ncbi:MAG: hypothetical protein COT73_00875 [Bdellovibrio sp. CG10_big_fil_rev_8_21_14_0_10_47_8]|nr:MAG: hypothetical protein COT73_00875 [Bdellovibrio sp. CG10_big_fil_rev_8_21_14_0_10_47_8]
MIPAIGAKTNGFCFKCSITNTTPVVARQIARGKSAGVTQIRPKKHGHSGKFIRKITVFGKKELVPMAPRPLTDTGTENLQT